MTRRLPAEYPAGPAYGFYSRWKDREPSELCHYAAAIGGALAEDEGFNLLPQRLINRQRTRARLRAATTTTLLLIALVMLGSALTKRTIRSAEGYLTRNKETLANLEASEAVGYIRVLEPAVKGRLDHIIGTLVRLVC